MKKATKRKILLQKSTKDLLSNTSLVSQKLRKLSPPSNLVNRNKRIKSCQGSVGKGKSTTRDANLERNEIMNQAESSSLSAISTKNRFDVLQSQESYLFQPQEHPQTITMKKSTMPNSTLKLIRKKNEDETK
jgi:hypothetical protein